jgi:hypothetical protein
LPISKKHCQKNQSKIEPYLQLKLRLQGWQMYQHDTALKDSLELPDPAVPEASGCVLLEMMM